MGEIERATGRKYTEARYTEIKQHPYISKMFGTEYAVELKPNHIPLHTKGDGDYVQFKTKTNPNDPWVNMPDSDVLWLPETNSIHVKVTKYNFYDIFKVSYCTDTIYTKDAEKCIVLSACVDIMRTSFDADWYSSYSTVQQAADRMEKQYHELMRRLTVMQPV
ncbi:MAG: hypothetical protein F4X97_02025 [Boseongicola sp. SB0662_bin_57]|nr:hypothetical protein [Boseongicola sp. SB0662_bin_57]